MINYTKLLTIAVLLLLVSCTKNDTKIDTYETLSVEETKVNQDAIEARLDQALAAADALLADQDEGLDFRTKVTLPAGSVNGLAAAIAAAGPGGKVTVACGNHYESGTVNITFPVRIIGEPGAVFLWSGLDPADPEQTQQDPAIYAKNTSDLKIKGLEFRGGNGGLRACMLLENVPNSKILKNKITGFQSSITGLNVDNAKISGNYLEGLGFGGGILILSGASVLISDNEVFAFTFPIFPSGGPGVVVRNKMHQGFFGIILCTLDIDLPDGTNVEAPDATNHYLVSKNESYNNAWGYIVIDGAFDNVLFKNKAFNNSVYDIELVGESDRFGPPTLPTSSNTTVVSNGNFNNITIKDCAPGSVIIGGTLVDTNADPCY
ncbi:MAG: hypothetical protein DHS20C18_01590 [Saprospiraceae bacterium]|nr:MAG: hypothetical protein DHS20C18_01590 [Saprospiraceae bacterium]